MASTILTYVNQLEDAGQRFAEDLRPGVPRPAAWQLAGEGAATEAVQSELLGGRQPLRPGIAGEAFHAPLAT